jgi:hypothetical protein
MILFSVGQDVESLLDVEALGIDSSSEYPRVPQHGGEIIPQSPADLAIENSEEKQEP